MRVLMVSPHPVYSPRGTPIAVLNRCRALSVLGHEIDLVTYPVGEDLEVPGLRYIRPPVPGIKSVPVGVSWRKVPLDIAVIVRAAWALSVHRKRYQVLHTHEEAGVLGYLARLLHVAHIYDMGNELSVVAVNYGFGPRHPLARAASVVERGIVRHSEAVIAHFPAIEESVRKWVPGKPVEVVFNVPLGGPASADIAAALRAEWSPEGRLVALYAGTLERYQGVDNLVEAMRDPAVQSTGLRLVVVGGSPPQVEALTSRVADLVASGSIVFTGGMAQEKVASALLAADVLVSPRVSGTNTPLKLFDYLRSGRPVLATRISSHTQVVDEASALLVGTSPGDLAAGLARLAKDPELRRRLSEGASQLWSRYGPDEFVEGVRRAYAMLGTPDADQWRLLRAVPVSKTVGGQ